MLAKDNKIKNLMKQRNLIEKALSAEKDDGNPSRLYFGQVFPENIQYFWNEGYDAKLVSSDALLAITKGLPVYVFTVRDDIQLTDEELKLAESHMPKDDSVDNNEAEAKLHDIIDSIFAFPSF